MTNGSCELRSHHSCECLPDLFKSGGSYDGDQEPLMPVAVTR